MFDLYIDIESGADVTEIINGLVSSGLVQVDELVESLNERFGDIAQFYYQSKEQDGSRSTVLCVNGVTHSSEPSYYSHQFHTAGYGYSEEIIYDDRRDQMDSSIRFTGNTRADDVRSLNTSIGINAAELEKLSSRWPAKVQLVGAALYSVLNAFKTGHVYIVDKVKLSNGITYSVEDAWAHKRYLKPKESAALGAILANGKVISRDDFKKVIKGQRSSHSNMSIQRFKNVYVVGRKDGLYKTEMNRYNEYRNNLTK